MVYLKRAINITRKELHKSRRAEINSVAGKRNEEKILKDLQNLDSDYFKSLKKNHHHFLTDNYSVNTLKNNIMTTTTTTVNIRDLLLEIQDSDWQINNETRQKLFSSKINCSMPQTSSKREFRNKETFMLLLIVFTILLIGIIGLIIWRY